MNKKINNFCNELQNLESLVKQAELNVGAEKISAWTVSSKQEDINKFIEFLVDIESQYELEYAENDIFANYGEWYAQERCAVWNALCSVLILAYRHTKHKAKYLKALCEFDEANNITNILYDEYIRNVPYKTRQTIINSYYREYGYDENKLIFLSCSEREEYEYKSPPKRQNSLAKLCRTGGLW